MLTPAPRINEAGISTFFIILIVTGSVLALTAVAAFFWHSHSAAQLSAGASAIPTEEQKAYLPRIEFAEARMSAAENFLGATVTYLDARVTNKGTKTVQRLDVDLTFVDTLNQVVLLERAHPVTPRTPPLKPGQSRPFRVTFEHMPLDWNQAPPSMVPVYLQFE